MRSTFGGRVQAVAITGDRCGEGAVWCAEDSAVYWTDINRFLVHRLSWPDRRLTTWQFGEAPTALALTTEPGRFMVALASRLIWWWPASDRRLDHGFKLTKHPTVRLNDGRADPLGNFWVGSMYNNVTAVGGSTMEHANSENGALFKIARDGIVSEEIGGIGIANTLCWSPDHRLFYFADTLKNHLMVFDFDEVTGDIRNRRLFFCDYHRGLPDGSAIDQQGFIWNCRWGGGGIVRIAPDGREAEFLELPTTNVTTCVFGGADMSTLFVTSARNDDEPGDRLAGSLWAIDAGVRGVDQYRVSLKALDSPHP